MPRVTRAALRSNTAALSSMADATSSPLPPTPSKDRKPLGEIAGNSHEPSAKEDSHEVKQPRGKGTAKGRKRKAAKKAEDSELANAPAEVLEDGNQSSTSPAVEGACEFLINGKSEGSLQVVLQDEEDRSSTPAVEAAPDAISSTVLRDHELKAQEENMEHDSFVEAIGTRSAAKITQHSLPQDMSDPQVASSSKTGTDTATQLPQTNEDSFVEQIVARSPAKPVMRIEDSVEAIDAFEDEIEKIGEQIPNIDHPATPAKSHKPRKAVEVHRQKTQRTAAAKPATVQVGERGNSKRQSQAPASQSASTRPSKIRVSSIHKAPFQPTKSSKPPTVSSFELPGEAVARKLKEQREQRLQQGENGATVPKPFERVQAPKLKSTKPPTRSSFELPGEEVARKLKERREERLRQQELGSEAAEKDLKARSARLSQPRTVHSTATVSARKSLLKVDAAGDKDARRPSSGSRPAAVKRPSTLAPVQASKRMSSLSIARRKSSATEGSGARQSLLDPAPSRLSSATAPQRTVSNGKNVPHSTRGKEVFERTKTAKEEQDRLKRVKEEAAKKARAEAAERGRIASRQWAEKQKARKSSA